MSPKEEESRRNNIKKKLMKILSSEKTQDKVYNAIVSIVLFILCNIVFGIFGLLISLLIWPAWNYVIPYLFGFPEITYWRTFLLYFILSTLWKLAIIPFPMKQRYERDD